MDANQQGMGVDYVDHVKGLPLQEALWWFIENVSEDSKNRQELFFALRERVRLASPVADITTMADYVIAQELRRRGSVPSIWNVEDMDDVIEEDDLASGLDEDQFEQLRGLLLAEVSLGLEDVLASRGNEYVSDTWERVKTKLLAQVRLAHAAEASSL